MSVQSNLITLKGSAEIIHEYLHFGVHSILFQRGIYPPEEFQPTDFNGINVMVSRNPKVAGFITKMMNHVKEWIAMKKIDKISFVVYDLESQEPIERWDFTLAAEYDDANSATSSKPLAKIQNEVRALMRQITSTISFLPFLEKLCSFDILVHTIDQFELDDDEAKSEFCWESMGKIEIESAQNVGLKSFSTGVVKVDTDVFYKTTE